MNCTCKLGGPICGVCREREALCNRVKTLETKLDVVVRALIAHAADYSAHPCSSNNALEMLRALTDSPEKRSTER